MFGGPVHEPHAYHRLAGATDDTLASPARRRGAREYLLSIDANNGRKSRKQDRHPKFS